MHRSGRAAWHGGQALSLWSGGPLASGAGSSRGELGQVGQTMSMMLWIRERAHHLLAAATWELCEDDKRDWALRAGQSGGVGGMRSGVPNQGNRGWSERTE